MAYAGHTLGVRPPLRRQVAPTCVSLAVLLAALIPAISARVMAQAPDDGPARDAAELADVEDSLAHDPSYKVRVDAALARTALIDEYLGLYANDDTVAMTDDAKHAIDVLFARALAVGLAPPTATVDWAP